MGGKLEDYIFREYPLLTLSKRAANVSWYALIIHTDLLLEMFKSCAIGGMAAKKAELLKASRNWAKQKITSRVYLTLPEIAGPGLGGAGDCELVISEFAFEVGASSIDEDMMLEDGEGTRHSACLSTGGRANVDLLSVRHLHTGNRFLMWGSQK